MTGPCLCGDPYCVWCGAAADPDDWPPGYIDDDPDEPYRAHDRRRRPREAAVSEVAIPADLEPLWAGDANSREWYRFFGSERWQQLVNWLRGEGFDEGITHRVEIFLLDMPFVRVHHYIPDERGHLKLNDAGTDALSTVTTIPLSSLPPFVNREVE